MKESARITWLVPDDRGGGVVSVAEACCRQAGHAGVKATLLLALDPTGHAADFGGICIESLNSPPPHSDIPVRLAAWLETHPQDVLILNGCEQADVAIPYVPASTRLIYAVHDTADRYFRAAVKEETHIDAILAVSETVAKRVRPRLQQPDRVVVLHNGSVFPRTDDAVAHSRSRDLIFLGGDAPAKGSFDILKLWSILIGRGFAGHLHWFGSITADFAAELDRQPAAQQIVRHGRALRSEIFSQAAACSALLMLSRVEPFGMVTVECMGMGCVPVAWDIETGTKEIVRVEEGKFAPLGDYEALASSVLEAVHVPEEERKRFARRVRQDFSEQAMWARYDAFLRELAQWPIANRPLAGQIPPPYRRPVRLFQLMPRWLQSWARKLVGRSPRLGWLLRDMRGI